MLVVVLRRHDVAFCRNDFMRAAVAAVDAGIGHGFAGRSQFVETRVHGTCYDTGILVVCHGFFCKWNEPYSGTEYNRAAFVIARRRPPSLAQTHRQRPPPCRWPRVARPGPRSIAILPLASRGNAHPVAPPGACCRGRWRCPGWLRSDAAAWSCATGRA